jgi:hypothetical protein
MNMKARGDQSERVGEFGTGWYGHSVGIDDFGPEGLGNIAQVSTWVWRVETDRSERAAEIDPLRSTDLRS